MITANDNLKVANDSRARRNERARAWRLTNPDKVRQYRRAYNAANIEKIRAWERSRVRSRDIEAEKARKHAYVLANLEKVRERSRLWYAANRERAIAKDRKRRGLPIPSRPPPDFCECCGSVPGKKALAVDHCHETGAFRGWLCGNCNTGIGSLGDSILGVSRAIEYLTKAQMGDST